MEKTRRQTYTMEMFMRYIKEKDIRDDADVQRAAGQWTNEQINELIATVLTEGYIPPILIGEDLNGQQWIIDGLQRSSSLEMYRYGNYKTTSAIRNSIIPYRSKERNEDGTPKYGESGDLIWADSEFNIKGKTYDDLPEELKKRFNTYQIETVIFENISMERMSELIQKYNNHTPMNTAQRAFTYIGRYAREVKDILNSRFFLDFSSFTDKEKTKGVIERAVLESVMCIFHFDQWNKQMKKIGIYLNDHATKQEFVKVKEYLTRLENVITDEVKDLFNSKDCFLWLALFDKFSKLGISDEKFVDFLEVFKKDLRSRKVDGLSFDEVDKNKGTKDRKIIASKMKILTVLMCDCLHIKEETPCTNEENVVVEKNVSALSLIKKFVDMNASEDDVDFHYDNLKAWTVDIDVSDNSNLYDEKNLPSMIAIAAYAFTDDEVYDDETMKAWFSDYEGRNPCYIADQKENFIKMKSDLEQFVLSRQRQLVYA